MATTKKTKTQKKIYAFKFFDKSYLYDGGYSYPFAGMSVPTRVVEDGAWAPRLTGTLVMCEHGYHACTTFKQLTGWSVYCEILTLVELSGVARTNRPDEHDKSLARSYRIVGTLTGGITRRASYGRVWSKSMLRRAVTKVLTGQKISATEIKRILTTMELV